MSSCGGFFSTPEAFKQLASAWLRIVDPSPAALDELPDRPHVWQHLVMVFSHSQDWPLLIEARARLNRVEDQRQADQLARGLAALERRDVSEARAQLQSVLGARPSRLAAPRLEAAVSRLPAGPLHRALRRNARLWLEFGLDQCLYRGCPFAASVFERLAGQVDELTPEQAQRVRVVVDGASASASSGWNPLVSGEITQRTAWLQAGRIALERGQPEIAATILERAPPGTRRRLLERELGGAARMTDTFGDWELVQPSHFAAEVQLVGETKNLSISFTELDAGGAAVEAIWDGTPLGTFHVRRAQPVLTLAVDVAATTSLLELRLLGGRGRPLPGSIS